MKKKYSLKIFLYAVLGGTILASGCAISAFSFAWFSNNNNVTRGFGGSTTGAYFARGNGSEGNPYVINKPIHLYNLAWLQYVGFFKGKEPYFIIERDLDMSGWTLPPIGTTENPFLGHLDGYDTTHSVGQTVTAKISNLTISNSFEKYNGRHPSSQTLSTFVSPEITGLFGVVGEKTSTIEPSVKNLYLDKISIDSTTNNALSGVVAGYVNGSLSNILINDSSLNLKDGTNKLTGYDSISNYTSVGYCEPNYRTTYVKNNTTMYEPQYVGNASFNPTGGGGGEDQGWGGSISMLSLNRRINYIGAVSTHTLPEYSSYNNAITSSSYNLYTYLSGTSKEFKWNDSGTPYLIYINDGTLLPLNIDEEQAFAGNELEVSPEGNKPTKWHTTNFYKTHTSEAEIIKKSNTGYLVGDGEKGNNSTIRSRKYPSKFGLSKSYGSKAVPDKYDPNTIVFHSIDTTSGKEIEINSSNYGSFNKFNSVKEEFDSIMDKSPSTIHGFHFMNTINPNSLSIKEAENVVIDGLPEKNKYQFVKSALNFTVKEQGYITTILGSYFYDDVKQSLFDIFKIERKSDGTIESAKQIKKIYGTKNDIHYSYDDSAVNNLLFDFTKVSGNQTPLSPLKAYYFEFPILPGDYVIGKASDSDKWNAYLMYLDIGANAGGTEGAKVDRTKIYELLEQISEGFTYPTGVAIVDFDNAVNDVKKLTITIGSTYSGKVTFNYNGSNNAQINVNASNSDTGLAYFDENMTINNGNGTITDSQVHGTIANTETQRLTYFDYDKETKITNVLTFSQTRESSSSAWSETKREDYQSGENNTTFVGVGNLTIYEDDGKSTTNLPELLNYKINKDTNVFKLKMLTPLEQPLEANWLPLGTIPTEEDAANYYFTLTGYNFTLKKGTEALSSSDYSITKNAEYALSINGMAIKSSLN